MVVCKMPQAKGRTWIIWLKWSNVGWRPVFAIKIYEDSGESARDILEAWAANAYPSQWGDGWRKKFVRILPEGKLPKGYKGE